MKKAIVIGSGIGGLGAAVRLAHKGYEVTVLEKNDFPGGKLCSRQLGKYRFDYGPSIFTMPQYVEELFTLVGKDPKTAFPYNRLDPIFRYFYEDGSLITGHADPKAFAQSVADNSNVSKDQVDKYLSHVAEINDLTNKVFIQRSLHKWKNYLTPETFKGILNFSKIDAFKTMHEVNHQTFKDAKVEQLFDRYATYNGSNAYEAPGTLNVIQHYEVNLGAYLPKNGMQQISQSVYDLAVEMGVNFVFETEVKSITTQGNKVTGVETDSQHFAADLVMSNMDVYYTYKHLIPDAKKPTKILNQPKSGSALVFYWGIKKKFDHTGVHNILFSHNYQKEMDTIFKDNTISDDPTIYINITSKKCPQDAPDYGENWFTMINVPNNNGQDWDQLIADARKNVIAKINRMWDTDVEPLIEEETFMDPRLIDSRYRAAFGSIYGNRFSSNFSAFFRHPNFSKQFKNLFFCGGTYHPGSSIPLSLMSAKIATQMTPNLKK